MKKKMDVIIIGDSQVGKTSILNMYHNKAFNSKSISTIGLDFVNVPYQTKDG